MQTTPNVQAYRAGLLTFHADPAFSERAHSWYEDGLLIVADGKIQAAGDWATLHATLPPDTPVTDYRGKIITAGFIDAHIH